MLFSLIYYLEIRFSVPRFPRPLVSEHKQRVTGMSGTTDPKTHLPGLNKTIYCGGHVGQLGAQCGETRDSSIVFHFVFEKVTMVRRFENSP